MVGVQQRADIHETASGRGKARVQRVGRGFAGPFGKSAAEFGGMVVGNEGIEPGVQRILDITGLVPVLPVLRQRDEAIEAARANGSGT